MYLWVSLLRSSATLLSERSNEMKRILKIIALILAMVMDYFTSDKRTRG